MKIGFDGKRIFHNFRGLGNYSRTLVEGLLKYAPENQLFLFTPPFGDKRAIDWASDHPNAKIVYPSSFKRFPALWRSFQLHREIQKTGVEIYHGLSHELPFFSEDLKCKKIVTIHDLIFKRYPHFFSPVDRLVYSRKYSYSTKKSDAIIAICEQTRKDLIDFMHIPSKKIEVIYQSCQPIFYQKLSVGEKGEITKKYNLPEDYLLYVGALEPNKNLLNLVRAFNQLNLDNLYLIVVGKGNPYKEKIIKEFFHLKEKIIFYDFISYQDLPAFYQMAKIFVFPSFFEGFGIPIIEALYSRTPVITTKGYCFPEAGGPSTMYVDTSNPREIYLAILKILKNRDLAIEMAENGFDYVQKFNLEKTTQKVNDFYQRVISRKNF